VEDRYTIASYFGVSILINAMNPEIIIAGVALNAKGNAAWSQLQI